MKRTDLTVKAFAQQTIAQLQQQLGGKKGLCALSGGVDSAVSAALVHKACPDLVCIFVDHGLMRLGEPDEVVRVFRDERGMNLIKIDAADRFLAKLAGVTDPEKKRKIIGEEFIKVFEEESKKLGAVDFLVQGTIYPDVIESGIGGEVVKSHHNVGGLPSVIEFKELVEPLRELYKDEVRELGLEIGLPEALVMRQPFPGPGLGIRVIGEITRAKLDILRAADFVVRDEIRINGLDNQIWQYFAVILDSRSVGVTDGARTYNHTVAVRAINSVDGMTAEWANIPLDVLRAISSRITREVKGVGRVVYDITSKPPATIEWE